MKHLTPFGLAVLSSALFYFSACPSVAADGATRASKVSVTSVGRINAPLLAQFRPIAPLKPIRTGVSPSTKVSYSRSAMAGNMVTPAILLGMPAMVIIFLIIKSFKGD